MIPLNSLDVGCMLNSGSNRCTDHGFFDTARKTVATPGYGTYKVLKDGLKAFFSTILKDGDFQRRTV